MMTKQEFFRRENGYFFFDDPAAVAGYCKKNWPEDCKNTIRAADKVCRNSFLFDFKWDLERTWDSVDFGEGPIDWEYMPGDDIEFIFQFNRHRYLICLGQAYWLTGDEKYIRSFVRLLDDWITNQPHTKEREKTTWRILEAGFRGEFWVKALQYVKDSPLLTDELTDKIYRCLVEHGEYIIQMHSHYRYISNWGVIENHGLFEIGIAMPEGERRDRFIRTALDHLESMARMQIMEDGTHWEQSTAYHNEVLHCYEDVLILAERNRIPVSDDLKNRIHKMALTDAFWKKPDHHQFMTGDSDDTDIRDYISVAAFLFSDPCLKSAGYPKLDFESVWDLGLQSAVEYEKLESREPDFTSVALEDSGNFYLRDGWKEDGSLLHLHCGTMGAGHGHSDKLHLDLVIGGEDVLTDAGRYSYVSGPDRFAFKNPDAHNTITVDGKFFTVCKDSWECSKLCQPVKQSFKLLKDYDFIQGGHLGYMDLGVFVNRKVVYIKPSIYLIMDELYGTGTHTYQQYWNFSDTGKVTAENRAEGREGGPEAAAYFAGQKAEAELFFMTPGIRASVKSTKISRHYNQFAERGTVMVELEQQGFASLLTVIHGRKRGEEAGCQVRKVPVRSALKGIQYPPSMAEGINISLGQKEYVVIICHQEVNSPTDLEEADGCLGYGNVIVFDKQKGTLTGTVLNY